MIKIVALLISVSTLLAGTARAETFTSRSAFEAGTASRTVLAFDAATADDEIVAGTTYVDTGVIFADTRIANLGPQNSGFAAGYEYGSGYLEWQSGNREDDSVLDIAVPSVFTAVAFDFYVLGGENAPFRVTVGGQTFNLTTGDTPSFFGFTSGTAFSSLRLSMPALLRDATIFPTVDNFTFGQAAGASAAVPELATWALMLLGFGGIGCALRRRDRETLRLIA